MKYRNDRYGNQISILGYGCMRFSLKGTSVDISKAREEIKAAIDGGVNYFDTAYTYPGNEAALGEIIESLGVRDRINITTKLPHYLIKKSEDMENFFREELRRLRTDHVDYYLMHMLTDVGTWERLKNLGITEWLAEKKAAGQIRQVGFSYHGNSDEFIRLLDVYDWDLCQIQYNYLDENSQAGRTGLDAAAARGLPVIIMEPLRGGRLANSLPEGAEKLFRQDRRRWSPAKWGFRWLWNQPEITCVLSGMNSLKMVEENLISADEAEVGEFTEEDNVLIGNVIKEINSKMKVGCTGCRYCMPCPQGVDIPGTFAALNRYYSDGMFAGMKDYFMCTAVRQTATDASRCIGCGKCEQHCPQKIEIRKMLKLADRKLGSFPYKVACRVRKIKMKY
ncbi:MAG: aldo/keto reductase [Lachnospiraceae bacterium]|nr:aldo/keto reductase [Lachnospiraceae bacterium]